MHTIKMRWIGSVMKEVDATPRPNSNPVIESRSRGLYLSLRYPTHSTNTPISIKAPELAVDSTALGHPNCISNSFIKTP